MKPVKIIAAEKRIGQTGGFSAVPEIIEQAHKAGLNCTTLTLDPLRTPWHSPQEKHHFRSGCAPLEALAFAQRLIHGDDADLVLIQGKDLLRSEYTSEERQRLMAIYPEHTLPEAYTLLSRYFCQLEGLSQDEFLQLRDALFDNLKHTAMEQGIEPPAEHWFQPLTDLFRGVDCANPVIDFEGSLLLAPADSPLTPQFAPVTLAGIGIGLAQDDGPEHAMDLAHYHALEKAAHYAQAQSGLELPEIIRHKETLLELYTCYPVVPLAFLLKTATVNTHKELLDFIKNRPLTCTGGMNLARAPWNNPALNGLITLCHQLQHYPAPRYGVIHANGGLGYRQGVAVLSS